MSTLAKLLVELGLDGEELVTGLETVSQKTLSVADGVRKAVGGVIVEAASQGAQAMAGFVSTSVDAAGTFEAKMNTFAAVTGTAVEDAGLSLDQFSDRFLELGAETAFSAAQAQDAAIALVKGGVDVTAVMGDATAATLDLAGAGGVELAQAADIVAKQLGVWGETGVTATDVANSLAQAANASTVDVDELAMGLANVSGSAKVAGVDFNELVQTMALIAPGFSSASDAGTSLKTMISRMIPTTDDAIGKFKELGLITTDYKAIAEELGLAPTASMEEINKAIAKVVDSQTDAKEGTAEWFDTWNAFTSDFDQNVFYDAQGNFLGMENAAKQLQGALAGLSEEQKIAALNTMFGSDAIRAAAALAGAGAEGYNAMGASMLAAGSAAEQAAKMQQGYKFSLDSLFGSIETLQIILGSALMPVLTDLINSALIPAVNAVSEFVQQVTAAPDPLAAIMAAIEGVIPGFTNFVSVGQQVVGFITDQFLPIGAAILSMILMAVVPGFIAWATAAGTAAIATITAMLPILIPIALVGAAIGLLVAAWTNNWGDIQGKTAAVVAFVTPAINKIGEVISWLWSSVLPQAVAAVSAFVADVISFFSNFQANVTAIWESIYAATIGAVVKMLTDAITRFDEGHNNILTRLAKLSADFNLIWDTLKQRVITTIVTFVTEALAKFISFVTETNAKFEAFKAEILAKFAAMIAPAVQSVASLVTSVLAKYEELKTAAATKLGELISQIVGMDSRFSSAANSVGNAIVSGMAKGIKDAVGKLIDAAVDAAQSALDAAKDALGISSPSKVAADQIGKPFAQGIIVGAEKLLGAVSSMGATLGSALVQPMAGGEMSLSAAGANAAPVGLSGSATAVGSAAAQKSITVYASYANEQSESSLRDDLRLYEQLYG